jgi:hypothetical protein
LNRSISKRFIFYNLPKTTKQEPSKNVKFSKNTKTNIQKPMSEGHSKEISSTVTNSKICKNDKKIFSNIQKTNDK